MLNLATIIILNKEETLHINNLPLNDNTPAHTGVVTLNWAYCEDNVRIALVDLDNAKIIMQGDTYHDHIEDKIEGALEAMTFCNIHFCYERYYYFDCEFERVFNQ